MKLSYDKDHLRNIIFGLEDGFVSTTGVLFGVATATSEAKFIFIAGIITVLVEATSMGAGAYLSEKSSEYSSKRVDGFWRALVDGIVMFISYIVAGTVCVLPYIIFNVYWAKVVSILVSVLSLFFIGFWPQRKVSRGIEVFILGGLAILIGYLAGGLLQNLSA